jgi:hypothetical protein
MPSVYKNIMRLGLSSIEIPNVEWLFSPQHGNINLSWRIGNEGPFQSGSISVGNYSSEEFAEAIQNVLGDDFTVSVDTLSGLLTVQLITGGPSTEFTLRVGSSNPTIAARKTHWGIGYYMGFRSQEITSVDKQITGTSIVLIQSTPYYLVQLLIQDQVDNIQHRLAGNGSLTAFAKVILRDGSYTIEFDDNSNLLRKEYTFLAPVNLPSVRIRVVDPFGDTVNLLDTDWSMTLEVYEVVNSRTYSLINETYNH